jgi:hypothetical protein
MSDVSIKVVNPDGTPAAGANISFLGYDPLKTVTLTTDNNGNATYDYPAARFLFIVSLLPIYSGNADVHAQLGLSEGHSTMVLDNYGKGSTQVTLTANPQGSVTTKLAVVENKIATTGIKVLTTAVIAIVLILAGIFIFKYVAGATGLSEIKDTITKLAKRTKTKLGMKASNYL